MDKKKIITIVLVLLAIGSGVYLYVKSEKKKKQKKALQASDNTGLMPDSMKQGK